MFSRHVTKDISAYCHGELSQEDAKHFAEHIISCSRCRTKYEEVKRGIKLAEQLPQLSAPDRLWQDLESLLAKQIERPSGTARSLTSGLLAWPRLAAAAVTLLIIGLAGLWLYNSREPTITPVPLHARQSWLVWRLSGAPKIGTRAILNDGQLAVGDWLETDGNSRAHIKVGSIGNVDIGENTRVRLVVNQPNEHRLELERGKMSAQIWAPPRLFFVDTPSAVAADLGCAYTLEVDDHGGSLLRVTSGWVALQLKERESIVPAGAACETRSVIGPGSPYFEDASPAFRDALGKVDFNPHSPYRRVALLIMLNEARIQDTLTLWHLLPRVNAEDRVRIYETIAALVPTMPNMRAGILEPDEKTLTALRLELQPYWFTSSKIGPGGSKDHGKLKKGLSPTMKEMAPK